MRFICAILLVSGAFVLGMRFGSEGRRIDLETFDLQAQIIRDLTRKLAEAEGRDED